ncbi:hypothetical protein SLV14_007283 [Streptomyces sp. Je 1-4]|uniref:hypothetical protein n=1 Tax=Streptomyces TaxID=1883 RepID=UPI0021DA71E7|nr:MULTISPECIES: hypothetical protein [unclassified Streptomyces]UYB44210.1 hypothetical protein SLV14_007283 [Streptomyces sp. Je 1-4]UZQ40657.1 hypothetical protein SLV14N_007283 [Streptomyces sp. Je 1-4] [Streptomyces sp. Je 1-4 4N24]UZQ48074.1 hypothetical protein SLV14NA_007283 [Streptomyces sp. Je 1-4] [Streptomyces sp. Je 1-4 4N24_ara]
MADGEQGADGRALSHLARAPVPGRVRPTHPGVYSSPLVYKPVDDQGEEGARPQGASPVPQQSTRGAGMPRTVTDMAIAPTNAARAPRRPTDCWEAVS